MQLADILIISNCALTIGVLCLAYVTWKLDQDIGRIDWWQQENMRAMGALSAVVRTNSNAIKRKPAAKKPAAKAKTPQKKPAAKKAKPAAKKPATKRRSTKAKKPRKKANSNPGVGTNGEFRVH